MENGTKDQPSLKTLFKLADALNVSLDYLTQDLMNKKHRDDLNIDNINYKQIVELLDITSYQNLNTYNQIVDEFIRYKRSDEEQ